MSGSGSEVSESVDTDLRGIPLAEIAGQLTDMLIYACSIPLGATCFFALENGLDRAECISKVKTREDAGYIIPTSAGHRRQ